LGIVAGSLSTLEAFWRAHGFQPDVPDTVDLWRFWRSRAYDPRGRVVVFLGTSRIRGDVDLDMLAHRYPTYSFIQLGVSGNFSPIGTLRSLALDTGFRGIVICEVASPFLQRSRWADQETFFLQPPKSGPIETLIYGRLRDHTVILDPRLGITRLVRYWYFDGYLTPSRCRTHFDRSLTYSDIPVHRAIDEELAKQQPVEGDALLEGLAEVRESVQRIKARGGDVVLVSLPSALPQELNATNGGFKTIQWSRIAELTGALCMPLEGGDSQGKFRCSAHVHLGKKEALRFTEYLVAELGRRHVLD
jgi:hypothetical protein